MKYKYWLGVVLLCAAQTATAQSILKDKDEKVGVIAQNKVVLSGTVTDKHGTPLPQVTIAVENTTSGTYTDDNGRYSLPITPGKHTLVVSYVGYQTLKTSLNIQQNKKADFTLEESSVTLNSVEVYGSTPCRFRPKA